MNRAWLWAAFAMLLGCSRQAGSPLLALGSRFQSERDAYSLARVVEAWPEAADTSLLRQVLGAPDADMGFDYRYLLDSVGPGGCVVGAVFHINEHGLVNQQWIGEICE